MKTVAFDHESRSCQEINLVTAAHEVCKKVEEKIGNEMLISTSDDFTLILWNLKEKKIDLTNYGTSRKGDSLMKSFIQVSIIPIPVILKIKSGFVLEMDYILTDLN